MDPDSFLDGDFQNIFELSYFSGKELVPTGWNVVDDDKTYPRLSSRSLQIFQAPKDSENDDDIANGRAGSESSNEDSSASYPNHSSTTRMADESDEDELNLLPNNRVSFPLVAVASVYFPLKLFARCLADMLCPPLRESINVCSDWGLGSSCPLGCSQIQR